MDIFNLETLRREVRYEVEQIVADRVASKAAYFFLLICACILATLGLLTNSSAVIIGAMIVAPLTWPILRIAYAIVAPDYKLLISGIKLLFLSIVLALVVSSILGILVPLPALTDEVLSRISPTIIDLIVALVAGAVIIFALIDKKISQVVSGVAIAASLLPPLCVSGIGLTQGRLDVAIGGMFLAVVNIIAILFVASVILSFLVKPIHAERPLRRNMLIIVVLLVIGISIPLFIPFSNYVEKTLHPHLQERVRETITQNLTGSFVQNVTVQGKYIDVVVLLPENTLIPQDFTQNMQAVLKKELQRDYILRFHVLSEKATYQQ